jgi:protein involved in polysaccharide export with SLBB domain
VIERFLLVCAAALVFVGHVIAQTAPGAIATDTIAAQISNRLDPSTNTPVLRSTYQLRADDELVIHATDIPEINGKAMRLDPDGDLRLPMIGRVHAAGMTLEQLEGEVTARLKVQPGRDGRDRIE